MSDFIKNLLIILINFFESFGCLKEHTQSFFILCRDEREIQMEPNTNGKRPEKIQALKGIR